MENNLEELKGSKKAFYGHMSDEELKKHGFFRPKINQELTEDEKKFQGEYRNKVYQDRTYLPTEKSKINAIGNELNRRARDSGQDKFIVTDCTAKVLRAVFDFWQENKKGILISGDTGVGKTTILSSILSVPNIKCTENEWLGKRVKTTNAIQIVSDYNRDQNYDQYLQHERIIDDLGSEPIHAFAKKESDGIIKEIIELRYANRRRTHFTTNLSMDEIFKKYGKRVHSRLNEMCHIIEMTGTDYRL